jgi:hypothetical protein
MLAAAALRRPGDVPAESRPALEFVDDDDGEVDPLAPG